MSTPDPFPSAVVRYVTHPAVNAALRPVLPAAVVPGIVRAQVLAPCLPFTTQLCDSTAADAYLSAAYREPKPGSASSAGGEDRDSNGPWWPVLAPSSVPDAPYRWQGEPGEPPYVVTALNAADVAAHCQPWIASEVDGGALVCPPWGGPCEPERNKTNALRHQISDDGIVAVASTHRVVWRGCDTVQAIAAARTCTRWWKPEAIALQGECTEEAFTTALDAVFTNMTWCPPCLDLSALIVDRAGSVTTSAVTRWRSSAVELAVPRFINGPEGSATGSPSASTWANPCCLSDSLFKFRLAHLVLREARHIHTIVDRCFQDSSLRRIDLRGTRVQSIPSFAFSRCERLVGVCLRGLDCLTALGACAFSRCSALTAVDVRGAGCVTFGSSLFEECGKLQVVAVDDECSLKARWAVASSVGSSADADVITVGEMAARYPPGFEPVPLRQFD